MANPEGGALPRAPADGWAITRDGEYSFDADLCTYGQVYRDAYVKNDGCVEFARYFNAPKDEPRNPDDRDQIHLCSIASTIGELIDLLRLARTKFGDGWADEADELNAVLAARGWVCPTESQDRPPKASP